MRQPKEDNRQKKGPTVGANEGEGTRLRERQCVSVCVCAYVRVYECVRSGCAEDGPLARKEGRCFQLDHWDPLMEEDKASLLPGSLSPLGRLGSTPVRATSASLLLRLPCGLERR